MSENNKDDKGKSSSSTFFRQDSYEYWESRIFSALTLIVIGVILFLNTTGQLSWSIWLNLFRYWPLFLVMAGISIILSFNRVTKLIASIVSFLIFIFILFSSSLTASSWNFNFLPFTFVNQETLSDSYNVAKDKYTGLETADLRMSVAAGKLNFSTNTDDKNLLATSAKFNANYGKPVPTEELKNNNLAFQYAPEKSNAPIFAFSSISPEYNINLDGRNIKSTLRFDVGAGEAYANIKEQKIELIKGNVGAGKLEITMDSATKITDVMDLDVGVGSIKLFIPSTVGFKIKSNVGLGAVTLDGKTLPKLDSGEYYKSANYSTADNVFTIDTNVGVGSLEIITR